MGMVNAPRKTTEGSYEPDQESAIPRGLMRPVASVAVHPVSDDGDELSSMVHAMTC